MTSGEISSENMPARRAGILAIVRASAKKHKQAAGCFRRVSRTPTMRIVG